MNLEQCVYVVWHYHPCPQVVTRAMKKTQRVLNDLCNFRSAQKTPSAPPIQICLQLIPALLILFDSPQIFPLGTERFREAVRKPECDKLCKSWFVPVRQIAAFMPPTKPCFCIVRGMRRRPSDLTPDQVAQFRIVRWARVSCFARLIHDEY